MRTCVSFNFLLRKNQRFFPSSLPWTYFSTGSPSMNLSGSSGGAGGSVILEFPLDKMRSSLMRTRANDPTKVQELMDGIREIGLQIPDSSNYGVPSNFEQVT